MLPYTKNDADLRDKSPSMSKYKMKKQFENGNYHLNKNLNLFDTSPIRN